MRNKCECPVDQRSHQEAYDAGVADMKAQWLTWADRQRLRQFAVTEAREAGIGDLLKLAAEIEAFVVGDLPA